MAKKKPAKKQGLSPKQQRFVQEYLVDLNGTQAAIRAGYSHKTANEQAARLLANVSVGKAVTEGKAKAADDSRVSAQRVIKELIRLSFFDSRKLFKDDGSLKQPNEWDDDTAAVISGVEVLEQYEGSGEDRKFIGYLKKFRLWSKTDALKELVKRMEDRISRALGLSDDEIDKAKIKPFVVKVLKDVSMDDL